MSIFNNFYFFCPKTADIIIFDESNNHILQKVISQKFSYFIYKQRPIVYYLTFKILFKFIINLKFIINHNLEKSNKNYFFANLIRTFNLLYMKTFIEFMKPKAVITYTDNSINFSWLSKYCKICPFIAFQNGLRLSYFKNDTRNLYLQHFFCWGENIINLYNNNKYTVNNFYPVGSLAANIYFDFNKIKMNQPKYDLLIVSSWRGNIGWKQDVQDTMSSMKKMDILLAKYISIKKIKAAIILRSEVNSNDFFIKEIGNNEIDYFKKIYKDNIQIIENNFYKRKIYKNMQNAKVIISCLSSALVEAYGIGKKVMYFNFTNNNKYHCDLDPIIVSSPSNWESFRDVMDNIFEINYEDYCKLHQDSMYKMMSFHKNKNALDEIKHKIDEIISNHA